MVVTQLGACARPRAYLHSKCCIIIYTVIIIHFVFVLYVPSACSLIYRPLHLHNVSAMRNVSSLWSSYDRGRCQCNHLISTVGSQMPESVFVVFCLLIVSLRDASSLFPSHCGRLESTFIVRGGWTDARRSWRRAFRNSSQPFVLRVWKVDTPLVCLHVMYVSWAPKVKLLKREL